MVKICRFLPWFANSLLSHIPIETRIIKVALKVPRICSTNTLFQLPATTKLLKLVFIMPPFWNCLSKYLVISNTLPVFIVLNLLPTTAPYNQVILPNDPGTAGFIRMAHHLDTVAQNCAGSM